MLPWRFDHILPCNPHSSADLAKECLVISLDLLFCNDSELFALCYVPMGNKPSDQSAPSQEPSLPLSAYQRRVLELEQKKTARDRLLEQYRADAKSGKLNKKYKGGNHPHEKSGKRQQPQGLSETRAGSAPQPEEGQQQGTYIVTYTTTGGGVRGLVDANTRMPTPDTGLYNDLSQNKYSSTANSI